MALNLQPYRLLRIDELTYSFTTDDGDIYKCFFISYANYFSQYSSAVAHKYFAVNLELVNPPLRHKSIDKRIADTVIKIITEFLDSKINAVVYVCDNSDDREKARARKFLSWYDYASAAPNKIIQVNSIFEISGAMFYTALLVHFKNKMKSELINAYLEFIDTTDK